LNIVVSFIEVFFLVENCLPALAFPRTGFSPIHADAVKALAAVFPFPVEHKAAKPGD
jgi:hypothetical protein